MLEWLATIGESIGIFVQFVSSMLSGLLSVFALMGQSVGFMQTVWVQLPSAITVFAIASISLVIVFQLIGR